MKKKDPYIVLDIETTGLDPEKNEIIEVCAVRLDRRNEAEEEFYSLIRIDGLLPKLIVDLTGIKDSDLKERGGDAGTILKEFKRFVADGILVGHNIDGFDIRFLKAGFRRIGLELANQTYDTLKKARELFRFYSYRLEDCARNLGIKADRFHNARSDVGITVELFRHLQKAEH